MRAVRLANPKRITISDTLRLSLPAVIAAPAVHPVKGTVGSFARVEWGRLFHEHYLAANPHLRSGPTIDPGCYTGGQPTTDSLPRYRSFRTAMVGGPNAFQREADACTPALLKQIKFAQSNGFKSLLWTNIRVSPATVPPHHLISPRGV